MEGLHKLTEDFVRSVISHEDDVQEVLEAIESDSIDYIRTDLYFTLKINGGDVKGLLS